MKKGPKKKVTIEDLAVIVNRGFNDVYKKIDAGFSDVNEKFKEVYKKMDKGFSSVHKEIEDLALITGKSFNDVHEKMDKGFGDINSRLDNVEIKVRQVDIRLATVEDNQLDFKLRIDVLNYTKTTDELRGRIVVLEKKVGVKGR